MSCNDFHKNKVGNSAELSLFVDLEEGKIRLKNKEY
jgi:hypothetical protein